MSTSFFLDVVLRPAPPTDSSSSSSSEKPADEANGRLVNDDSENQEVILASANTLRLSQQAPDEIEEDDYGDFSDGGGVQAVKYAAVFLPSTLVEAALMELFDNNTGSASSSNAPDNAVVTFIPAPDQRRLSRSLLSMTHPFLAQNFVVKAIISVTRSNVAKQQQLQNHAPADVVLLDLSHVPTPSVVVDLLDATKGQLIHASENNAVLSILLISDLRFSTAASSAKTAGAGGGDGSAVASLKQEPPNHQPPYEMPTCPVCLYRVDPMRLGMPKTPNHDLCSKFCPPPNLLLSAYASSDREDRNSCQRQRRLRPWPLPSHCACCHVIDTYWRGKTESRSELTDVFCCQCAMQETLWVCMTCGFVGCGRYSNKHAAQHFADTGHPYSLELATLRIWDYVTGEFAHRPDLLDCPSSPPRLHQWMRQCVGASSSSSSAAYADEANQAHHWAMPSAAAAAAPPTKAANFHSSEYASIEDVYASSAMFSVDEKSPKKATMIGEEYEALLQSALEEQAQHYEGEITRLLATLTAEQIDTTTMTVEERVTVEKLQSETQMLRTDIERVGRELLDAQAQEAGHRATSQRLLREQQVTQELLKKIHDESAREQEDGQRQIEELEQQIADLTANQRMRDQFSQDEELLNAQIFGTTSSPDPGSKPRNNNKKSGKKSRRLFRK